MITSMERKGGALGETPKSGDLWPPQGAVGTPPGRGCAVPWPWRPWPPAPHGGETTKPPSIRDRFRRPPRLRCATTALVPADGAGGRHGGALVLLLVFAVPSTFLYLTSAPVASPSLVVNLKPFGARCPPTDAAPALRVFM
ncbi:hypothetical protein ABZP36_026318 [Zizania latifolia]